VAVRLAHRPEHGLGDLCPAADDDEPLAEYLVQRLGLAAAPQVRQLGEDLGDAFVEQPLDLQLDLNQRPSLGVRPAANGAQSPDGAAGRGHMSGDFRDRGRAVGVVEANGDRWRGVLRTCHG